MSELPWFKFYTEAFGDPKLALVASDNQVEVMTVLGIWTALLCLASNSPARGTLVVTGGRNYTVDELDTIIGFKGNMSTGDLHSMIDSFISLEMIDIDEFGAYRIKHFEERQETKEEKAARLNRERQKRYQNSHKEEDSVINNVTNNGEITTESSSISISNSLSISDSLIKSNIFQLYSEYIGDIKPAIEKTLVAADGEYPAEWFPKAFEIMRGNDKKSWAYVEGILKNWQANGYKPAKGKSIDRVSVEARSHYGDIPQ